MSLGTKLVQALQKEAAMKRPFPINAEAQEAVKVGRKTRVVSAQVRLCDNDRLSHLAEKIVVHSAGPGREPAAVAQRFVEKTTYLSEALQFVECDAGGSAIVRSTPQTMSARRGPYFEARVARNEITLRRFQPHQNRPGREAAPFVITDENLSRLVEDAAAALNGK